MKAFCPDRLQTAPCQCRKGAAELSRTALPAHAGASKLIVNCETVKGLVSMRPRRYPHEPHGKVLMVLIVTLVQIL